MFHKIMIFTMLNLDMIKSNNEYRGVMVMTKMMYRFISLIMAIVFGSLLSACSEDDQIKYHSLSGDWAIYDNAAELVEYANVVYIGEVSDISFEILDERDATPVNDSTPTEYREIYTVYEVNVIESYKGNKSGITKIRLMGGMENYHTETQMELMKQYHVHDENLGIPIWADTNKTKCEIGGKYLFILYEFETGYPTFVNLEQSVFALTDPTRKQTIGENATVYYTGERDERGLPLISPKDIISEFGAEAWESFSLLYEEWKATDSAQK